MLSLIIFDNKKISNRVVLLKKITKFIYYFLKK
ncbi:Hypothetical Protein SLY_0550 [Strawberry lethal yellows phytoplasma (CPA) str. NZSb11]|uniref:Uncharacterized protein n=1 Tax=Strawberry lethal yellows phytoplasma (CPA) str. NZSb11 TaxID=980422 RepID=R4S117_PHYAS|nr:Hypothetical Protein SLY_0550 [Strawberry lethal yellows phytoplasma (CPA) str. NZSb11]